MGNAEMIVILPSAVAIFLSILCNGIAIVVFFRCRLLVFQIRLLLLFITSHSFLISCIFTVIIHLEYDQSHDLLCALKCVLWAGYRIVPVVMTTVFAVDRSISVVWPFWYQRKVTKRSILIMCLALTLALYVIFGLSFSKDVTEDNGACSTYLHMNHFGIHSMIVLFASSMVVTTVSYAVIFYQSDRYMSATNLTSFSLYNSFRMSFLICGVTFALYLASITSCAASVALWHERNNKDIYHVYMVCAFFSVAIISINPIFYISRFRESRFQVRKLLCVHMKDAERMETTLRLEYAGIPLPLRKSIKPDKISDDLTKADSAPKPQISTISLSTPAYLNTNGIPPYDFMNTRLSI
ncbi:mas-related G-protein coupled receptor member X2-like [Pecten maximus]|uniref:mas-related G-protein coupled receptor member X2-like n=1 Tax=Pecten maximus TaxID=6579 RepID=UPI0014590BD1|nr:mas-related G-protein coupled receptor member X2-like [Pecten maximus]